MAGGVGLRAAINVDAFAIAVTNLVQNAVLHGARHTPIIVAVTSGNVVRV